MSMRLTTVWAGTLVTAALMGACSKDAVTSETSATAVATASSSAPPSASAPSVASAQSVAECDDFLKTLDNCQKWPKPPNAQRAALLQSAVNAGHTVRTNLSSGVPTSDDTRQSLVTACTQGMHSLTMARCWDQKAAP
jgi:hypothetical protein